MNLLFSEYSGNEKRSVKECEDFNLDDNKWKRLRDFLTGVAFYGINEKEGKANVFGRETNIYRETNEI